MRRFLLGFVFTAASVALLFRVIDWSTTAATLRSADPTFIALAVTCLVLSLGAKTVRWRLLLPAESAVTTPRLYRILHISFLLNNVLPARLGDVARVAMTSRQPGLRFGHVLSSMLTERVTDFVTLVSCFVLVSPFLPIPDAYLDWLHLAWFTIAGMALVAVVAVVLRHQLARLGRGLALPARLARHNRLTEEARSFQDGWRQLFSRKHLVRIWGWSGMAWAGAFAINYLLMRALRIDAPVTVAVLLTCTTNLAMLLPSSPGYLGVFHAAAMLSLRPFDVGNSTAFAFAILAHLVNVLPVSLIGAAFLLAGRDTLNLRGARQAMAESGSAGDGKPPDSAAIA
ncbi:MAG: flippase-like domain-containing protein [Dehalococcoidia bacterium]|nr:flippase-like domain-containing protein [Dehalococcoidia bacterium]